MLYPSQNFLRHKSNKLNTSYPIFLRFHAAEAEIQLSRVFQKKTEKQSLPLMYMYLKYIIVTSNNIYLAYKFLYGFIHYNTRSAFS